MCGQITTVNVADIAQAYGAIPDAQLALEPGWTLPSTRGHFIPLVVKEFDDRIVHAPGWGLRPAWVHDQIETWPHPINIRAETCHDKPGYRRLLHTSRGIVPVRSFDERCQRDLNIRIHYERAGAEHTKTPPTKNTLVKITHPDGQLLSLGAIYATWRYGDHTVETCAILTTPANDQIAEIHNRMPLILTDPDTWLDPDQDLDRTFEQLQPYPSPLRLSFAWQHQPKLPTGAAA